MQTRIIEFHADSTVGSEDLEELFANQRTIEIDYDDEEYEDYVLRADSKTIGTISRHDKWWVEKYLFRDNVQSIHVSSLDKAGFYVQLTLKSDLDESEIPVIDMGTVAGIYKISTFDERNVYIGQSGNIQRRIAKHWLELSFGTHHNLPLQRIWDKDKRALKVEVIELLPEPYRGSYEQQKELEKLEKHWISNFKSTATVLNRTSGEIVPTKRAVAQFDQKTKLELENLDTQVKATRKTINSKIKHLEEERRDVYRLIHDAEINAKTARIFLKKHKGILRFIFGSKPSEEVVQNELTMADAQKQLTVLNERTAEIRQTIFDLKSERKKHRTSKERGIYKRKFE